jgi:hypothetical protein
MSKHNLVKPRGERPGMKYDKAPMKGWVHVLLPSEFQRLKKMWCDDGASRTDVAKMYFACADGKRRRIAAVDRLAKRHGWVRSGDPEKLQRKASIRQRMESAMSDEEWTRKTFLDGLEP